MVHYLTYLCLKLQNFRCPQLHRHTMHNVSLIIQNKKSLPPLMAKGGDKIDLSTNLLTVLHNYSTKC